MQNVSSGIPVQLTVNNNDIGIFRCRYISITSRVHHGEKVFSMTKERVLLQTLNDVHTFVIGNESRLHDCVKCEL